MQSSRFKAVGYLVTDNLVEIVTKNDSYRWYCLGLNESRTKECVAF